MKPACLIVGAGPGIGQSVAQAFAREGYALALAARQPARLDEFRRGLEQEGTPARAYAADASDETSLRRLFAAVRRDLGQMTRHPEARSAGGSRPRRDRSLRSG